MDQQIDQLLLMLINTGYTGYVHVHPDCSAYEIFKNVVSHDELIRLLRRNASPNVQEYIADTMCPVVPKSNPKHGKRLC